MKSKGKKESKKEEVKEEKIQEKVEEKIEPILPKENKPHKTHIMLKGIALHLFIYIILAVTLSLLGVPNGIIFLIIMILLWGLFVISYSHYKRK